MVEHNDLQIARHGRGIKPVLSLMESLGVPAFRCLESTGIDLQMLDSDEPYITLDQEHTFYRNLIQASGKSHLGLFLGQKFTPEKYGILGFAMLSASDMGQLMALTYEFNALTFSHFRFTGQLKNDSYTYRFEQVYPLPEELVQVYSDRDITASLSTLQALGIDLSVIKEVHLMHSGQPDRYIYETYFSCPVKFEMPHNALIFEASILRRKLSGQDLETLNYCRLQCQNVLEEMNVNGTFEAQVIEILALQPGYFPNIEEVAAKVNCNPRTLRRMLKKEGTSFSKILQEVRLGLAKDYLKSGMEVYKVSELLNYADVAAFSRAFKRWTSYSPKEYRELPHSFK